MKKKILHLILTAGLLFGLTACQKDASENPLPESESQHQIEETVQAAEVETESVSQTEVVQNEYFSVVFDSVKEEDEFYVFTFIFTNVSDIPYYKGDELYQPGEFWEKNIRIKKEKLGDYCKNATFIHYKLYDLSVYDTNAQQLFAGGASFNMNEDLEVCNLEIFVDIPIEE